MTTLELCKLLVKVNFELYFACLTGTSPNSQKLAKLIDNPRAGDLVHELSRGLPTALGYLVAKRIEFVPFEEEEGGYLETYWYIEGLDGELQKWYNCSFRRIVQSTMWAINEDGDPPRTDWVNQALRRHNLEQLMQVTVRLTYLDKIKPDDLMTLKRFISDESITLIGENILTFTADSNTTLREWLGETVYNITDGSGPETLLLQHLRKTDEGHSSR